MQVLRGNNEPFATEKAAKMFAGRRKWLESNIVPVEGGYAIDVDEADYEKWKTSQEDAEEEIRPATTPWRPATLLNIPESLKDPNYVYRFCNKKTDGNISKKLAEGWEIDTTLSAKIKHVPTINDGTPLDSGLHIRELVVMRMRKETKESRDKYYRDLAQGNVGSSNREYRSMAKGMGIDTYDETSESRNGQLIDSE